MQKRPSLSANKVTKTAAKPRATTASKNAPTTRASRSIAKPKPSTNSSKATVAKPKTAAVTPKPVAKPKPPARVPVKYEYDICLSFAGEDRAYVQRVANCLRRRGIRYFYDNEQEATLLGKDLFVYLDQVYQHKSRFCAMFLSRHYKVKKWTNHERQSAQARAFVDDQDYVLPFRLDDTPIPGVRPTVGYTDASKRTPSEIADIIAAKVNGETVAAFSNRRRVQAKAARAKSIATSSPQRKSPVSTNP